MAIINNFDIIKFLDGFKYILSVDVFELSTDRVKVITSVNVTKRLLQK